IGINPGLFAAYKGHHYAGPGNHFWKCLHLSGLTPEPLTADDDYKLLRFGIGFTNMVARATKGSADLTRKEIKEGSHILLEKLKKYRPKIAVFNGKLIYEVFSGKKEFGFGRQPNLVEGTNTYMWVMPSSSARCAQLPRAADKVPYYAALKKFRDYLNGTITHIDESDIVFADTKLKKREFDALEDKKPGFEEYDGEGRFIDGDSQGVIVKQESGLIPGKKKRGRPKKIKNPDDVPPPDSEKMESSGMEGAPFSHMAPYPQSMNEPSYYGQPMGDSPYSKQSPVHMQHYSQSPKPMPLPYGHSDLSSDLNSAISADNNLGEPTPLTSPGAGMEQHPDFDNSNASMAQQQQQQQQHQQNSYNPNTEHGSPGSTPGGYGNYMGYHDEQQQNPHQGAPTPISQTTDEHSHHSHPTPPHNHQNTPTHSMSPHPHEQYGMKRQGQDVASKSLSDLESLVDQIPSIAESGGQRMQQQHGHPGMGDESLAEKLEAHQSYMSSYGGAPVPSANYSPPLSQPTGMYPGDGYSSPIYSMGGPRQPDPPPQQQQHSKSYTVENLASSNYTPSSMSHHHHHQAYPNILPGPHYPVPMPAAAGSPNGYLFGGLESSLMQRGYPGMASHHHPSLHGHHPMANPYPYNSSYTSSFDTYSAAPSPSNVPGIHTPQPNYHQAYSQVGSPSTSSTPPTYLQQNAASRPPLDLAYDGV
ncbi:hypothetical protein QAD02_009394, partial [Eretmocerus hayati]